MKTSGTILFSPLCRHSGCGALSLIASWRAEHLPDADPVLLGARFSPASLQPGV
jgi:hypothetical protein